MHGSKEYLVESIERKLVNYCRVFSKTQSAIAFSKLGGKPFSKKTLC
jgi:hypothetical protein